MADITYTIKLYSSGNEFSTTNYAGAEVRLRNSNSSGANSSEYTGNSGVSGDFTEEGHGSWSIGIDEEDSGYFLIQTKSGSGSWTDVKGYAPIYIQLESSVDLDTAQTVTGVKTFSGACIVSGNWDVTGEVDITSGDLKIDGTAITSTAAELNYLDGTGGAVAGYAEAESRNTTAQTSAAKKTLTDSDAGYIECVSSTNALDIVMPALSSNSAGVIFVISVKTAGNDVVITDNASDSGFVLVTGDDTQVTGTTITFSTAKDFVILKSSGIATGYWAIIGGYGVDLS